MHKDETYAIDRVGNGGVIVLTPFGEVTLPWSAFRWEGVEHECGVLCAEHGDPRSNSVDYVRLGMKVPS
jgi:hypothetical protein